jgi:hypothetical protein
MLFRSYHPFEYSQRKSLTRMTGQETKRDPSPRSVDCLWDRSIKLFESLGFVLHKHVKVFGEIEVPFTSPSHPLFLSLSLILFPLHLLSSSFSLSHTHISLSLSLSLLSLHMSAHVSIACPQPRWCVSQAGERCIIWSTWRRSHADDVTTEMHGSQCDVIMGIGTPR